jgi:Tfp pilus assembly protein PilN
VIKVNLARTQLGQAAAQGAVPSMPSGGGSSGSSEGREAIVKVLVIVVFTGGLYLFERQNITQLNADRATQLAKATEAEQLVQNQVKELDSVKDIGDQARELEDKLKILKLLSRLRLREVKTLDFMQSSIPEKVWLKSLEYEAEKDDVIHGHLNFKGNAVSTEDLSEFTKRLEDSAYLAEVITIRNQEVAVGSSKATVMREFEFNAQVEVKN